MGIQPDDTGQKEEGLETRGPEAQQSAAHDGEEINSHNGAGTHAPIQPVDYIGKDWSVVPVPYRSKTPKLRAWQKRTINAENVSQYFNGGPQNIGIQLGRKSKGLADVDLDCIEAIWLAHYFLPETDAVFGRASKPKSHWLYYLEDAPDTATIKFADEDGKCIIELRLGGGKKGAQTVFPGSVHESGEPIEWVKAGDPAKVSFASLERWSAPLLLLLC